MDKPLAVFTLRDHLDHRWTNELVGFPAVDLPPRQPLAIRDDAGNLFPCQVADGRVHFVVDELPPLSQRQYALVTATAPGRPPVARVASDVVELDNGLIAVRIPAARQLGKGTAVPAPILAVRRGRGPWLGEGRLSLSPALAPVALAAREVAAGPLWRTWELDYQCAGGEHYRVLVKLFAGRPNVEITEGSALCRESRWEFSVRAGLQPTQTWTHPPQVDHRNDGRLWTIDYQSTARQGNLGAIQMPNYSGIWVPDDYYYFAFLGATDAVAAAGVTGGFWDYPYENQIELETTPAGDAFFRLSIKAGHRRWLLHVVARGEVADTRPFYGNSLHQAAKRYETPLDQVKDYVLEWDDAPGAARPLAIATRDQLEAVRRKACAYGKFREYVASLNPDLPGDYTYYHAGTHRPFKPDHRNDPAVLYVTAESAAARQKQAAFLKDVVMTGLKHRRDGLLGRVGHLDHDGGASINVGRGLRPWAALYDLAAAEGVFSPAEDKLARATFAFYGYKINDPNYWPADHLTLRDDHPRSAHRTHWFPRRQHDWCFYNIDNIPHNFHGDLWSAAGCIALTFPSHPASRHWVERTLEFWENELTYWVFPEGEWLESSTYTLNSMKDYLIYCRMLANGCVRDYFTDERLQRIFRCLAEHLGPHDQRLGGSSLPVMGDGGYPNGYGYVFGWLGGLVAESDPEFAALMNQAWKSTGEYLTEPGRFGLNFCDFLFIDPCGPTRPLPVLSSKWYHGLGAILRHAQRTPEEIYLFIKAGIIYSHFHEPEGTFQLWWNSVPVCDEYGVQYGKGDNGVYVWDPSCHNCVAIDGQPLTYNKGDFTTFISSAAFDYVVVEAPVQRAYLRENEIIWGFKGEVGPAGWHKRHFLFVKPHYLYIYDDLECPYPTKYHLNIKADGQKQQGNHVHYDGRLGVDLEFLALDLGPRAIQHSEYNVQLVNAAFQPPPKFYHQLQLTIAGQPHEHYATLLVPHTPSQPVTVANDPGTGGARITRGTVSERALLFPQRRDISDGTLRYVGQAGAVREQDGVLTLLQARGTMIGHADRLLIAGDGPFTATLERDGRLTIAASGVARWLTLAGPAFRRATCDGQPLPIEAVGPRQARIYVPTGEHHFELA